MGEHSTPKRNPYPSSAETVATDDDLLNEILVRLPIRSLIHFKTVAKHWLSLIANPHFVRRRTRTTQISKPSGLFLQNFPMVLARQLDFIPLKLNPEIPTKPPSEPSSDLWKTHKKFCILATVCYCVKALIYAYIILLPINSLLFLAHLFAKFPNLSTIVVTLMLLI